MIKYVIWGATTSARYIYRNISENAEIVAFVDNDEKKWGGVLDGYEILPPSQLSMIGFDKIAIVSISAMDIIKKQLLDMGIEESQIDTSYIETQVRARQNFVRDFAKLVYRYKVDGCVAEAGVFQGDFAKEINKFFHDKVLYLFDTFEGFDQRDVKIEKNYEYSEAQAGHLSITSEELVLKKMTYPDNCVIRKGYFPESACGIDEKFCFVNLDMDLYQPTLAGLKFFWDRMVVGGIIVVHDYFSEGYKGVENAIAEFSEEYHVVPFPIGDAISVAFRKDQ